MWTLNEWSSLLQFDMVIIIENKLFFNMFIFNKVRTEKLFVENEVHQVIQQHVESSCFLSAFLYGFSYSLFGYSLFRWEYDFLFYMRKFDIDWYFCFLLKKSFDAGLFYQMWFYPLNVLCLTCSKCELTDWQVFNIFRWNNLSVFQFCIIVSPGWDM